jgi:hypothetical protein
MGVGSNSFAMLQFSAVSIMMKKHGRKAQEVAFWHSNLVQSVIFQ